MIAAGYARVSTVDQDNSIQIAELTKFAERNEWALEVFQDQISGGKNDRPGLNALMDAARRRLVDVVLVWKLDRFGRSTVDVLTNIQELTACGVRFIAITQGIDTDASNPISRFLVTILSAVAELEREMIRERIGLGVSKYKKDFAAGKAKSHSGKNLAPHRPKKIFDRLEVVRLRAGGLSLKKIARKMKIGESTVFRTIQAHSKSSGLDSMETDRNKTGGAGELEPAKG